ncbi:MAG TPA: hypothetical protein PK629_09145 [Oscillospiraceae bacterium]|nr:hypothetical protein [Oscillospiraceae bacterium]HPF56149.1 hypothetical protein [Clostridiales bacterium]HPK35975.1 hypothetical protein [Oscillospiraceae bacterium]HPR76239.1 hypothetical protein [Oscillospiraceae bacterium]
MSSQNDWAKIREALIEILKSVDHYRSENKDETCFLTAYQLAVLLNKESSTLVKNSKCHKNIGGKSEGKNYSLSQYIAIQLSQDIKDENIDNVEMRFFNIDGLEQFSFLDEKKTISQPSNTCFSMFRYIGQ